MDSINGLPAHVLLVHAPVVLVPLATIIAVVAAIRPGLRRRLWWLLPSVALIGLVATQLAVSSGHAFDEIAGDAVDTTDHEALAETTRNLVVAFAAAAGLTAWYDRRAGGPGGPRPARDRWIGNAGVVVTTLTAIMSTIWMIRTGDEGARLVWDGVLIATAW